ncbi:MAG: alpha/beta fold hydrolase [bacterium]|nr:alpha/beta fold hydrolase [bacterium]
MKKLIRMIFSLVTSSIVLIAAILAISGFLSRRLPNLKPWHTVQLTKEFRALDAEPDTSFEDYLKFEEAVFEELEQKVSQQLPPEERGLYNRYDRESFSYPKNFDRNWNRSFQLVPEQPRAGVLMLHGLTDSPYSMHALAEELYDAGYYVLGLRFPGHGTAPSALTTTSWKDWQAAARIALKHVRRQIGEQTPLYLCGYSTGGTLALKMTFDALESTEIEMVDKVFLFSPAVAVSATAIFADWHKLISFIPFFEKIKWTSVNPEYDPFKYNSFSKHGGGQVHQLALEMQAKLFLMKKKGRIGELPPIITFQSLADSTVIGSAIVEKLYDTLENEESELIIFDVNHYVHVAPFIKEQYRHIPAQIETMPSQAYRVTVVTNVDEQSLEVVAKSRPANTQTFEADLALNLFWPSQLYSLSHVSIIFPPDDAVYGGIETRAFPKNFKIGTLTPKGETSVLNVSMEQLMRLRYNPFFDYLASRVLEEMQ